MRPPLPVRAQFVACVVFLFFLFFIYLFIADHQYPASPCRGKLSQEDKHTRVADVGGPVVQWLALWTLNPEIRVQVSAGPFTVERVQFIQVEPWNHGTI